MQHVVLVTAARQTSANLYLAAGSLLIAAQAQRYARSPANANEIESLPPTR